MTDIILKHKFIAVIVLLVVIAGAWYGLSGSSSPSPDLVSTTPSSGSADQTLVETLLTLRTVSLSGTIFSDPAFESLKDFGTQIVSEPVGRPNPFAPLSSSVIQNATSTKNPQLFAPKQQ